MDEEWDDQVADEGDGVEDGSFGGAPAAAPVEEAPAEPPAPATPAPLPSWANPLVANLPPTWKSRIAAGTPAEVALEKHYGGLGIRANQEFAQQRREIAAANERMTKYMERVAQTLGIELEDQKPPAPDPAQVIEGKVDRVLQMQEERELDSRVDQVSAYSQYGEQEVLREEPEYHEAVSYWTERQLATETQLLNQALMHYNMTRNPEHLALFPQEHLVDFDEGRIPDFASLVRFSAGYRVQRIAADAMTNAALQGGNASRAALAAARAMGWKSSREQSGGNGHQPAAPAPAPVRTDPKVDHLRRTVVHQPRPAGRNGDGLDAASLRERVSRMSTAEYTAMLDDATDPEKLMKQISDLMLGARG